VTEATRTRQIELALKQREEQKNGETQREPLRDKPLPVVEVPLDLPVLNPRSFRIAAQLDEHADRQVVLDEFDSPRAQEILSQLVILVHRNVDALRESLATDGQQEVGMITRKGVLINANTRCILLRELSAAGKLHRPPTLRVAVLPLDYGNKEELLLESVLQQQKPLKDEYRFVNDLRMIRRLRDESFGEAEIAKALRLRKSAKGTGEEQVRKRLAVLHLMESMRRLTDPPLRLTDFDQGRDNLEAWLELLSQHQILEAQDRRRAEAHLRRWMIAYFTGFGAVHKLRHAKETWVEDWVVGRLDREPRVRAIVDVHERAPTSPAPARAASGLDVLGGGTAPTADTTSPRVNALFQAVVEARRRGADGVLTTANGEEMGAVEFQETVAEAVRMALGTAKSEAHAASALDIPAEALIEARAFLQECEDGLVDVLEDPGFAGRRQTATDLATEVEGLAVRIAARLRGDKES